MHSKQRVPFTESRAFIVLLGTLTAFDPLSIDMYLPAFGDIQKSFVTTIANVELSVSTFFVGMALGQLFYGPLADRFGRRKPLLAGMILYLVATASCAMAPDIYTFILFRLLQSLGGCAGMVITRSIVRDLFEKKKVAEFFSNMALVMGLAPILAPTIGAGINQLFGWRAIFEFLAIGNLICIAGIALFLPETNKKRSSSLSFKSSFSAYGSLLKDRKFIGYLIPDAALRAAMFAYIAGSPFVFIELFHFPKEKYGWIFGLNGLGLMAASQINRQLLKRFDPDFILRWSVRGAALLSVFVFGGPLLSDSPYLTLGLIFLFLGTLNFVGPNSLAGALSSQGHQAGTASALYGSLQWSLASGSSFLVSYFHNGTAMPMTGVILLCGIVSATAFQLLMRNPIAQDPKKVLN
jgi:DHA1 family bicyclomycin/chloramphenicol resistance-like MFS transporter